MSVLSDDIGSFPLPDGISRNEISLIISLPLGDFQKNLKIAEKFAGKEINLFNILKLIYDVKIFKTQNTYKKIKMNFIVIFNKTIMSSQ